jgi:hypothetical protein
MQMRHSSIHRNARKPQGALVHFPRPSADLLAPAKSGNLVRAKHTPIQREGRTSIRRVSDRPRRATAGVAALCVSIELGICPIMCLGLLVKRHLKRAACTCDAMRRVKLLLLEASFLPHRFSFLLFFFSMFLFFLSLSFFFSSGFFFFFLKNVMLASRTIYCTLA